MGGSRLLHQLGKDFFRVLQESAKCELYHMQDFGINKTEIFTAGETSCSKCQSLHGKIFTITKALETMPIPVKDCENGFCRCLYLPKGYIERGSLPRLILRLFGGLVVKTCLKYS